MMILIQLKFNFIRQEVHLMENGYPPLEASGSEKIRLLAVFFDSNACSDRVVFLFLSE